ncbi:MAG: zinc-ribbon domain-containing protein [Deltaproteobacteria bacterium]|nr:zinc-ribbon domain-containing protein [Deltaproteobacteria bacterium]
MIIQCDKCGTKFRLDDSRVTGNGVRVRCTKCQNVFIVPPPPPVEEVGVEEVLAGVDRQTPEGLEKASRKPAPPPRRFADDYNLRFDFGKPVANKGADAEKGPEKTASAPAAEEKKTPASFDEIDFSFSTDRSPEKPPEVVMPGGGASAGKSEETPEDSPLDRLADKPDDRPDETREVPEDWELGGAPHVENTPREGEKETPEKHPFSDLDFGHGEESGKESEKAVSTGDWSIDTGDTGAEKGPEEKDGASLADTGGKVASFASAYGRDGKPADTVEKPAGSEDKPAGETLKFSQYFSEEMGKDGSDSSILGEVEESEEDSERSDIPERAASSRALLVAAIVFLVGGAVIYFSGIIDTLANRLMPPARVAVLKTVEIETIKGYYAENRNFGKFFVIEATIKNISGTPQSVKALSGVLYNAKGERIANRSVAPGRVVSAEDLTNLSKEDLQKPFKDPSGGTLPPKGTVPVMIPFTEPPQGIAEYGIDIVR